MTVLFAGWEPGHLEIVEGYGNYNTTLTVSSATTYDSTLARMSFATLSGLHSYGVDYSAQSEAWFHCAMSARSVISAGGTTNPVIIWRSKANASAPQLRMMPTTSGSTLHKMQVSPNGGSTWTDVGGTFTIGVLALNRLDVHYKFHATTGVLQVYVNETQVLNYSGALVSQHNVVDSIWITNNEGSLEKWWSEFVVTDSSESTVGTRIAVLYPTGVGAQTDWAGAYTDIDEAITDIGDCITSDTAGNFSVFDLANVNAAYNRYAVNTVITILDCTITTDASISDLQAVTRTASANYFSSNLSVPHDNARHSIRFAQTTNPATGLGWSISEVNSLQAGVKAV